jgi:hypothetical protein
MKWMNAGAKRQRDRARGGGGGGARLARAGWGREVARLQPPRARGGRARARPGADGVRCAPGQVLVYSGANLRVGGLELGHRHVEPEGDHLGFGRIVASDIEAPNMLANLV